MRKFHSRCWGSSLTVCARLTICLSLHRHERKYSGAHVCRVTFKHLPQAHRNHIRSFGALGQLFKIPPLSAQKCHSAGGRGVPEFFVCVRSPSKTSEPYNNPLWDFSYDVKKEERSLITKNCGLPNLLRWSHALRSDQNNYIYQIYGFLQAGQH